MGENSHMGPETTWDNAYIRRCPVATKKTPREIKLEKANKKLREQNRSLRGKNKNLKELLGAY